MKATSFHADTIDHLREQLSKHLNTDAVPDFAIVFTSVALGIDEVVETIKPFNIPVFGASSCGEILADGKETNTLYDGCAVVSLVNLDPGKFRIRIFEGNEVTSHELGKTIGTWSRGEFERPAIIVAGGGLSTDGEEMVKGILETMESKPLLFGGLAGDDSMFKATFVFDHDRVVDRGAIALIFDTDKVQVEGLATSGWVGLGSEKIITSAEGNVVYTIDNEPALDLYCRYLGISHEDMPAIGVEYPLLVFRDDGTSVLRATMAVDHDHGSITFAGTVPQKARVKISSSPGFQVIDQTSRSLDALHRGTPKADMILMISCMARHLALGPAVEEEIRHAQSLWNVPLIGFFSYGEIGHGETGQCDFHNETLSLAIFTEL
jgi:hypothetical protein